MLRIATDGSASPNPGPGGWAWVAEDGRYGSGAFAHGTNNIGELMGLRAALLAFPGTAIEIEYDSHYAKSCIVDWYPGWIRKGISDKSNFELIASAHDALLARTAPVVWTKVKGHARGLHPLNETADRLAARMTRLKADHAETGLITNLDPDELKQERRR